MGTDIKLVPINVNGYDTYYFDHSDSKEPSLIIAIPPHADKEIAKICGSAICSHLIARVDYQIVNGTRFILAYY